MTPNNLTLLIAAAPPGEPAMHNDLRAMTQAMLARGLSTDHIFSLHGQLDRPLALAFLRAARHQMDDWEAGSLFVHTAISSGRRQRRRAPALSSAIKG